MDLKEQADGIVLSVKSYVAETVGPRIDSLERELKESRATIAHLQQKLSAQGKELSALTRRALRKST